MDGCSSEATSSTRAALEHALASGQAKDSSEKWRRWGEGLMPETARRARPPRPPKEEVIPLTFFARLAVVKAGGVGRGAVLAVGSMGRHRRSSALVSLGDASGDVSWIGQASQCSIGHVHRPPSTRLANEELVEDEGE